MPVIDVGLEDYKPPELPKGKIQCEIKDAVYDEATGRLRVQNEIVDGQMTPDGRDPRGTQFSEFILVDLRRAVEHKDGGAFATQTLAEFCDSTGVSRSSFDTEELVGKTYWALVAPKDDLNGVPRLHVTKYLK